MEIKTNTENTQQKVYNSTAIGIGTLLGGPLAAGYFLSENFKTFNESGKARKTWIIAAAVMIAIFCYFFLVPELFINPVILLLIIAAVVWFLTDRFQGNKIRDHINTGGNIYSGLRTIGIGLAGLAVTTIVALSLALLIDTLPKSSVTRKNYGAALNEIAYDSKKISDAEIDEIGDAFINTNYFNDSAAKYVYAEKTKEGYVLALAVPEDLAVDTMALRLFKKLKVDMQNSFPDKKISINLVAKDYKDIVKRIE